MKHRFVICLSICFLACLPLKVHADGPIEDGVYSISCTKLAGFLGLGSYHSVNPYIYYVTAEQELSDDGYWVITNTESGYTIRNQATNHLLVFTYGRDDAYYKYMTIASESLGDGSEYWNIIAGSDGAYSVQSTVDKDYYWNLRSGTNMLGTYKGSGGNSDNERYVFHKKNDTSEPGEHDWVDLDLPSGTLWATCNVGANSPEEYGDYFAWGEITPKKSNGTWGDYSWGTYKWMNAGQADWTQINKYTFVDNQTEACWYNSNGTFIGDGQTVLLPEDDAATANWGSKWQMPSVEQMRELIDSENTTSTWTTMNGVNGRLVTSIRNNASIFLPAGGRRNGTETQWEGSYGFYWPTMTDKTYSDRACQFSFSASSISIVGSFDRYAGESIRPVRVEKKTGIQYPSDEYSPYVFPKALHVYLSDGRIEAYPLKFVEGHSEQDGKLIIETNLGWNYTYNLSEVDSVSEQKPDFATFETFKIYKRDNDQVFGTVTGEIVGDTVFVTLAAIGKRLTPTFVTSDEGAVVYVNERLQDSEGTGERLRFDKDVYYLVSRPGCKILTAEPDNKYFMHPYGRCVRVHVDWLTDRAEVPTIYINTADGQPITSKLYFKDATITIDGHDIFPSMDETPVQIKGRGNSSWGWPKKPYRLKFAEKMKPLGMTKGKNWVLLSNYQTGSLMSNAIGMKAANLMEASAANHIVPVDLYLNGEYRGSYNFTEKVGMANNSVDVFDESVAALLELDSYYDEPDGQKFRSTPYDLPINIKEPEFAEGTTQLLNYEFYHPKSTFCYREDFTDETSKYIFGPVWDLDWCFGYERNRTYFRNESTSNYWIDSPSFAAVSFIRDLRFKYEPLDSVYRQLWEEFMNNDLQELLEYCQDYYDFAKNSFDANSSKWGDYTDYATQAQQAASWLETRTQQIYADIVSGRRPDIPEPIEYVEFDNTKLYTITCERGGLVLTADHNGLTAEQERYYDYEDEEARFAIIGIEGQNYIYSPVTKKFLHYANNGSWVNMLGTPIDFDTMHPYGKYPYMMTCYTDAGQKLYFNHNSSKLVINGYSTPDQGNRFKIVEVADFDPTEALQLASASLYAVTNRYLWNGEVIGSEIRQVPKGAEPPAPSAEWGNSFVKLVEPADMPYQIEGETTIDYDVEWYGPFFFSSPDTDIHWYDMTIRSDYFVFKQDYEPYYPTVETDEDILFSDKYLWAFGGNPYHVVLYNRTTGFDESLAPAGDYPAMRAGEYAWDLLPNLDGFVLRLPGTTNTCLNHIGGKGGQLGFWTDNRSLTDNGSTFRLFESLVDGIKDLKDSNALKDANVIYNLAGQRVDGHFKGIVVKGGRKVLVK